MRKNVRRLAPASRAAWSAGTRSWYRRRIRSEHKTLPFDVKYLNQKTSGLEFEVKPGANEYPIRLAPPAHRKSR